MWLAERRSTGVHLGSGRPCPLSPTPLQVLTRGARVLTYGQPGPESLSRISLFPQCCLGPPLPPSPLHTQWPPRVQAAMTLPNLESKCIPGPTHSRPQEAHRRDGGGCGTSPLLPPSHPGAAQRIGPYGRHGASLEGGGKIPEEFRPSQLFSGSLTAATPLLPWLCEARPCGLRVLNSANGIGGPGLVSQD